MLFVNNAILLSFVGIVAEKKKQGGHWGWVEGIGGGIVDKSGKES